MSIFKGLVATPITAFDKNENVYEAGIRNLINHLHSVGVGNLFCIGSWGGFALMNSIERMTVAKIIIEEAEKNRMKTIINISATSTKEAILLARHAQDHGADAIATTWPYYYTLYGYTHDNILYYLQELIDSVDIPVHFYNNARTTGIPLDMPLFKKIIELGISGMKEGGGNLALFYEMMDYLRKNKIDFDLMPSSVTMLINGLISGVQATMIGSAMAFGEIAVQALEAFHAGNISLAVQKHEKLMMVKKIHGSCGFSPSACYGILKMRGVDVGYPRRPWKNLTDTQMQEMKDRFLRAGFSL